VSTSNLDKDGVKMLFETKPSGSEFYLSDAHGITSGIFISTDDNSAERKTENNITFYRVRANDVHYSDHSVGKTVRVNINGAGGLDGDKKNTWKDNPQFIWTPNDNKNAEFTYYFRSNDKVHGHGIAANHTECSSKMRGGIHTDDHDPRASCIELAFKIGGGSNTLVSNMEYNHPDYLPGHGGKKTKRLAANNNSKEGKWIGRKTIVWTNQDNQSVTARDYVDWNPFCDSGKPKNNWDPLQGQVYATDSGTIDGKVVDYDKPPLWGGMFTSRIDGFKKVDYAIVSIREIMPPMSP
jgi:hypothetical protein